MSDNMEPREAETDLLKTFPKGTNVKIGGLVQAVHLNGLIGTTNGKIKGNRIGVRTKLGDKAVRVTNLILFSNSDCSKSVGIEQRMKTLIEEGRLWEAQGLINKTPVLLKKWKDPLYPSDGTYSEIFDKCLELVTIPNKGKGYRATKDITKGSELLFDTAFMTIMDDKNILVSQVIPKMKSIFFLERVLTLSARGVTDEYTNMFESFFPVIQDNPIIKFIAV